jgi:Tfp pilus assembly protein PilN
MTTINLLPPSYASVHALRLRRFFWTTTCTIVCLVSVLTIAISIANTPLTSESQSRLASLRTVQKANLQQAFVFGNDLESKKDAVVLLESIARQPDWSVLLRDLASMCAGKTHLKRIGITLGTGSADFDARLNGTSPSQEQVGQLVSDLRNSEWFVKVTLTGTQRVPMSDPPRYRFDISCEISGFTAQVEALR